MNFLRGVSALAVAGALGLIGCNSSSPTAPNVSESSIVGIWNVISAHSHATMTSAGASIQMDTTITFTGTNTAQFNSDHSFVFISDNGNTLTAKRLIMAKKMSLDTLYGTWTLSSNQLTLLSPGDTTTSAVSINGNSMALTTQINQTETSNGVVYTIQGTSTLNMTKQ